MIDVNEALLDEYLDSIDMAERRYDAFEERVNKEVKPLYNEAREIYSRLLDEFGYTEVEMPFNDEMNT